MYDYYTEAEYIACGSDCNCQAFEVICLYQTTTVDLDVEARIDGEAEQVKYEARSVSLQEAKSCENCICNI